MSRSAPVARLLIIGRAPRRRVHETGMPGFEWKALPALQERVGTVLAAEDNDGVHNQV
jgi:hypothetical protein